MTDRAKPIPRPTEHQVAMLRRIKRGKLMATLCDGRLTYHYEDGSPCDQKAALRLIKMQWVKPEDPALIGDQPQSYVVRR